MCGYTVERLLLLTRTGRRYQLGRGSCTSAFTEAAPPGGYLAALQAWHSNTTTRPAAGRWDDFVFLHQVGTQLLQ